MKRLLAYRSALGLALVLGLTQAAPANEIANFADPLPNGGGETMFLLGLYGFRLYGGWLGPPRINLETPLGNFDDCTMWLPPMHVDPDGRVWGGQVVFYQHNQAEVLRLGFTNGHVDSQGFGAGPGFGGTVTYQFSAGGVQIPPSLLTPLQGSWFYFEFHNFAQGPSGPEWTASFACGARGKKGDMNCDGVVNFDDIDAFVLALSDPVSYDAAYPWGAVENADVNGDGQVNFNDVNPFATLLGVS